MSKLIDADTGEIIRTATEAEEDASDAAAGASRAVPYSDHRGVFVLDGRRVYVPLPRLPDDSPIGGPGGD